LEGCIFERDCVPVVVDGTLLGDGRSNKSGTGGYWWTQIDRSGLTEIIPNTGKVYPNDPEGRELRPGFSPGNGLEDDGSGNVAFHITGTVPAAPTVSALSTLKDPYWNATYGALCVNGDCMEYKIPEARLSLELREYNRVVAEEGTPSKGISFRVRAGNKHGGLAEGTPRPLRVRTPMDLTDVPDPSFGDRFGSKYDAESLGHLPTNELVSNAPFCLFAGSLRPDGMSAVGDAGKSCFCHFESPEIFVTKEWKTVCVAWSAMAVPDSCPGLANAPYPVGGITKIIPERLTKLHFDVYQPTSTEAAADFDLWFDDIRMLGETSTRTTAVWDEYCGADSGATVL
jgi:hypothetical protein